MALTQILSNYFKAYRNANRLRRIFLCIVGCTLLLCLCQFKTFMQRNREKQSLEEHHRLSRHILGDKHLADSTRCTELYSVNSSMRCEFVKTTDDCKSEHGFIDYIKLPYCTFPTTQALAFVLLVFWLIYLFMLVGTTADDYFCPALKVISDALNLSPNVAGVTFLAYGNGAPDIFSAEAALANGSSTGSLALSALIGAGMFVTTVVAGAVSLSVSFDLNQRPYLRDVLFYLGALAWTVIIVYRKKIDLLQAIGFIILYILYVLVVIIGRIVYQRYKRKRSQQSQRRSIQDDFESSYPSAVCQGPSSREDLETSIPVITNASGYSNGSRSSDETSPLLAKKTEAKFFLEELLSVSESDFVDSGLLRKIYALITIPIHLCLNLTIPVVELDAENNNWKKRLQIVQCLFSPLFCVFATKAGTILLGGKFPLAALVAFLGVVLAVVVAMTSQSDHPPTYHKLFSFMGFIASVVWIYSTANEIVNLLRVFGVVFKLSNEILGITLLAWGNSIGDLISNLAVAKQGYPLMAIAACFGGPLLNLLLGVGLSSTVAATKNDGALTLNTRTQDYISASFLAVNLVSSAVIVPLLGFRMPKIYGAYLISLYIAFVIVSILNEFDVIFA